MVQPLDGIRILDLSQVLAGPFATCMLGDLGAEVIKIEQPGIGDASRYLEPYFLHGESAYYLAFNRNKKSVTLDLQHQQGRETFYRLVGLSDVVLDNFRPSVLPRLGIDYDTLKKISSNIIHCSISGFGQEGPYINRPAFDGVVQAMGGVMSLTGEPDGPPLFSGFPIGDAVGGYAAMVGILTALVKRGLSGEGSRVDISLLDVQISLQAHLGQFYLASGNVPKPIGSSHPANVPVGAFACQDGKYLQVHCTTQRSYQNLAISLANNCPNLKDLPNDPRFNSARNRIDHRSELEDLLRQTFLTRPVEDWIRIFEKTDVPAGPVNNLAEALSDPQVLLRNMVVDVPHPIRGTYRSVGNPIKIGQKEHFSAPPLLGQNTDEILHDLLGYTKDQLDHLRHEKVI